MLITATQFKNNLGDYLNKSEKEDIYITKNGKIVSMLTNPNKRKVKILESLVGIIPDSLSEEDAKNERLSKK